MIIARERFRRRHGIKNSAHRKTKTGYRRPAGSEEIEIRQRQIDNLNNNQRSNDRNEALGNEHMVWGNSPRLGVPARDDRDATWQVVSKPSVPECSFQPRSNSFLSTSSRVLNDDGILRAFGTKASTVLQGCIRLSMA